MEQIFDDYNFLHESQKLFYAVQNFSGLLNLVGEYGYDNPVVQDIMKSNNIVGTEGLISGIKKVCASISKWFRIIITRIKMMFTFGKNKNEKKAKLKQHIQFIKRETTFKKWVADNPKGLQVYTFGGIPDYNHACANYRNFLVNTFKKLQELTPKAKTAMDAAIRYLQTINNFFSGTSVTKEQFNSIRLDFKHAIEDIDYIKEKMKKVEYKTPKDEVRTCFIKNYKDATQYADAVYDILTMQLPNGGQAILKMAEEYQDKMQKASQYLQSFMKNGKQKHASILEFFGKQSPEKIARNIIAHILDMCKVIGYVVTYNALVEQAYENSANELVTTILRRGNAIKARDDSQHGTTALDEVKNDTKEYDE